MNNILLTPEDEAFRREIRECLERELAPRVAAIEAQEDWGTVRDTVRTIGGVGYLKPLFPDFYAGPLEKPGLVHATLLSEEAAYLSYAFETTLASTLSAALPLARFATDVVRERYLRPLLEGESIGAICVTERGAGSDTSSIQTRIRFEEASREWIVNGFKRYISNASVADVYIVYGISNPGEPAQKGMSAILVPSGTPGMSFPRTYQFMGRRGCVVGEVDFHECRVPAECLIGERDRGFGVMLSMFNFERILLAGAGLGVARSAFDAARAHAQSRQAFGQALGSKQLIWDKISEMSWRIDAANLLAYRAAKLFDRGVAGKDLMKPAAMAKLVASESAIYCADAAVQILGGDGLTKEYGRVEQIYRDARALTIVGGTSEMAKYIIATCDLPNIRPNL